MSYVYITGDKHGDYRDVVSFTKTAQTTIDDVLIILGDNGVNYYGERKDRKLKKRLSKLPLTFFMVRGNHDMRPYEPRYKRTYVQMDHVEGFFMVEEEFPNLLFAIDGETYKIGGERAMVIGGAYSVDKEYRLMMHDLGYHQYRWFPNEQLTAGEMAEIYSAIRLNPPDIILSHTCPLCKEPVETFSPQIDQSKVDKTMETWLDEVYSLCNHTDWYCGHWHIDKLDGNVTFLYNSIKNFV